MGSKLSIKEKIFSHYYYILMGMSVVFTATIFKPSVSVSTVFNSVKVIGGLLIILTLSWIIASYVSKILRKTQGVKVLLLISSFFGSVSMAFYVFAVSESMYAVAVFSVGMAIGFAFYTIKATNLCRNENAKRGTPYTMFMVGAVIIASIEPIFRKMDLLSSRGISILLLIMWIISAVMALGFKDEVLTFAEIDKQTTSGSDKKLNLFDSFVSFSLLFFSMGLIAIFSSSIMLVYIFNTTSSITTCMISVFWIAMLLGRMVSKFTAKHSETIICVSFLSILISFIIMLFASNILTLIILELIVGLALSLIVHSVVVDFKTHDEKMARFNVVIFSATGVAILSFLVSGVMDARGVSSLPMTLFLISLVFGLFVAIRLRKNIKSILINQREKHKAKKEAIKAMEAAKAAELAKSTAEVEATKAAESVKSTAEVEATKVAESTKAVEASEVDKAVEIESQEKSDSINLEVPKMAEEEQLKAEVKSEKSEDSLDLDDKEQD